MKINEITESRVNEGFWDAVKGVGAGVKAALTPGAGGVVDRAKSAMQAGSEAYNTSVNAKQAAVGEKQYAKMAELVLGRWNQTIVPTIPQDKRTDPATLKKYLDNFLGNYFGADYSSNIPLATGDATAVGKYIRTAVNADAAGMEVQPKQQRAPAQSKLASISAAEKNIQQAAPLNRAVQRHNRKMNKKAGGNSSTPTNTAPPVDQYTAAYEAAVRNGDTKTIQLINLKRKQDAAAAAAATTATPTTPTAPVGASA